MIGVLVVADRGCGLVPAHAAKIRAAFVALMVGALVVPGSAAVAVIAGQSSFGVHQAAAPSVRGSAFVQDLRAAAVRGPLLAADKHAAQFLLLHLDRCFPVVGPKAAALRPGSKVVAVDAEGIDTGRYNLAAPRLSFSNRRLAPSGPRDTRSIGTLRQIAE